MPRQHLPHLAARVLSARRQFLVNVAQQLRLARARVAAQQDVDFRPEVAAILASQSGRFQLFARSAEELFEKRNTLER